MYKIIETIANNRLIIVNIFSNHWGIINLLKLINIKTKIVRRDNQVLLEHPFMLFSLNFAATANILFFFV